MGGIKKYLDYLVFLLTVIGSLAWFYVGATMSSPDLLPLVPALLERAAYLFVGVAGVLDLLGFSGGYGLISDDRSMMG